MRDEFSRFHPLVNLIFYIAVVGLTMFQMQIVMIMISLLAALVYHFYLKRSAGVKYLLILLIVFLTSAVINPLFSHKGATLLFYLFTGNPVTMESIVYGIASATVICGILLWFSSFNEIMTRDKMLAAMGNIFPHIETLLSMIFRFVPKFIRQGRKVYNANKGLGIEAKGLKEKIKVQAEMFSSVTTWALENSVDTADSMKARGYGTGRRGSYSNYRFEIRDFVVIAWILVLLVGVIAALSMGKVATYYYPLIRVKGNYKVYIIYTILCLTPMIINIWEDYRWHRLKSKI